MRKPAIYQAFLLKLWPVVSSAKVMWRVVLENPYTGERSGFKDLDALLHFLKTLTQAETEAILSERGKGNSSQP